MSLNSFGAATQLSVGDKSYKIYDLKAVPGTEKLPYSLKILAENLLRNEDGENITKEQIAQIANWDPDAQPSQEIQYSPARVLMQDFTGVPCIVDLATMRDAVVNQRKWLLTTRCKSTYSALKMPWNETWTSSTSGTRNATSSYAGVKAPSKTSG